MSDYNALFDTIFEEFEEISRKVGDFFAEELPGGYDGWHVGLTKGGKHHMYTLALTLFHKGGDVVVEGRGQTGNVAVQSLFDEARKRV